MALAVALAGLDGFGAKLWGVDPFWWNASALYDEIYPHIESADPWPATWAGRFSPEEAGRRVLQSRTAWK